MGSTSAASLVRCDEQGKQCTAVTLHGSIPSGSLLRTDAWSQAKVQTQDGTTLVLDVNTELALVGSQGRAAKLVHGALLAEVSHMDNATASIALPHGSIQVLGTRFLARTESTEADRVLVTRGVVRLSDAKDARAEIYAGEEGWLSSHGGISVGPTTAVGELAKLDFSSRSQSTVLEAREESLRGLGELKARRPGQTTERDHDVRLSRHDVKVRVADGFARTEIDETFQNDSGDTLEGTYRFPLPPSAQIERLALEVDGKLVEGAFVEQSKAAKIWKGAIQNATPKAQQPREEIIWVPGPWHDPALLEWKRGGRFELKIFPIPAHGSRRVVLAYTEVVPESAGVRRYTYPLPLTGASTAPIDEAHFDVQLVGNDSSAPSYVSGYPLTTATATSQGAQRWEFSTSHFVPSGDLDVTYALSSRSSELTSWAYQMPAGSTAPSMSGAPTPTTASSHTSCVPLPPSSLGLPDAPSSGGVWCSSSSSRAQPAPVDDSSPYVVFSLRPRLPRQDEDRPQDHVLIVDTSRSMVGDRSVRARNIVDALLHALPAGDRVLVMACDSTCTALLPSFEAPSEDLASQARSFLQARGADGLSDLASAVRAARSTAENAGHQWTALTEAPPLDVLYLGDGTASAGPTRPAQLAADIKSTLAQRPMTVSAIALGVDADTPLLQAMARAGGGAVTPLLSGQSSTEVALKAIAVNRDAALMEPTLTLPDGFTQVAPASLSTLHAGDETLVVARANQGTMDGEATLHGTLAGQPFERKYPLHITATSDPANAFVPRLFAAARIDELDQRGGPDAEATIVALSKRFSIASRYTSLLVLESQAMFNAFGIHRQSIAPSWTGDSATVQSEAPSDNEQGASPSAAKAAWARDMDSVGDPFGDGYGHGMSTAGAPMAPPIMSRANGESASTALPDAHGSGMSSTGGVTRSGGQGVRPNSTACPPGAPCFGIRPPRPMIPMHRVWDRKGIFSPDLTAWDTSAAPKIVAAESALQLNPDARKSVQDLYALQSAHGRLQEAAQTIRRWEARDPLDADMLVARADLAARSGDRAGAIRLIGSAVDAHPDDLALHKRLATTYSRVGEPVPACMQRVALADTSMATLTMSAQAIQCTQELHLDALTAALRADVPPTKNDALDKLIAAASTTSGLVGDVRLDAHWQGGADVDLALIDPSGNRLSWFGAAPAPVTVSNPISDNQETLALSGLRAGSYRVELTSATPGATVSGVLTVTAPGGTKQIPFSLTSGRADLGKLDLIVTSHLEPVSGWNLGELGPRNLF